MRLKKDLKDSLIPINLTLWNKICNCRPKKKKRVNDEEINYKQIFEKANEKVEKEMCLFNMLQTIQKLKAAVSILVTDAPKTKLSEIQNLYF